MLLGPAALTTTPAAIAIAVGLIAHAYLFDDRQPPAVVVAGDVDGAAAATDLRT